MIPSDRVDVLEAGVRLLEEFQKRTNARGRFIALYLGLRRLGPELASLGTASATPTGEIEEAMDTLLTKRHRAEPLVVLTAPFGGSTSPTAPYSTRTGDVAPGNRYATNTWRNNLGIQKGVGCPADSDLIRGLLDNPARRLACPHMASDPEGQHMCSLEGTAYRGEEHSIWLRKTPDGWQVVDLDHPAAYEAYLLPGGDGVPIFPLLAVLYCDAATGIYPERDTVGIPDFAEDFRFSIEQVRDLFDCEPDGYFNAAILRLAQEGLVVGRPAAPEPGDAPSSDTTSGTAAAARPAAPLPELSEPILLNSGIGAELAVADDLAAHGWEVAYRGAQAGYGFDLEAKQDENRLCVEVKSSVGFTVPELTEAEWRASQELGEEYVLAIVDFFGSGKQSIWYVRDPAASVAPTEREATVYRFPRASIETLRTETDFL